MHDPISLTDRAIQKAKELISHRGVSAHGLRVAAVGGGCSGLKYEVGFEPEPRAGDTVLELDGLRVFVDAESVAPLYGMTVDYVESLQAGGFKFVNPNATRTCGCGESFAT